ncbi:DUF3325 domain-containing protein [Stutzerimonas zhaodongensis]|uniref:DUF3325 domain-containing protein n=1 Tax=Stutzerimonas zhaodongensis TaxID=1176257 RepID=UPI002106CC44|nr:DUF3325 domain-containing protein [Stutzerimonas zhaodongensis]MCQ2031358.1 DUF3325 domain-containing protein [Stutzerimonas zhaodongensis]
MTTLAFGMAYLGMLALCLAMSRHHRDLFETSPSLSKQHLLRLIGACLLIASLMLNAQSFGIAIGLVIGMTELMFAGVTVCLVLAWRKRWVMPLGAILGLTGALTAITGW